MHHIGIFIESGKIYVKFANVFSNNELSLQEAIFFSNNVPAMFDYVFTF